MHCLCQEEFILHACEDVDKDSYCTYTKMNLQQYFCTSVYVFRGIRYYKEMD